MAESSIPRWNYRAFISYSHRDEAWARWLHRSLERYRVPSRLVGTRTAHGLIPRRLTPIFRDRDELGTATDLGREIRAALAGSECLIVICSPASARSHWVNEEVRAYKRLGHSGRIRCLIVAGEPGTADATNDGSAADECFCPALRFDVDRNGEPSAARADPVAADTRASEGGRADARLKLIAGMLGVRFDVLKQREIHRRRRRLLLVTAASIAGMTVATILAVNAYIARNEAQHRQAQTQQTLNFMLGDLHDKLAAMGRLDLMAATADQVMAVLAAIPPGSLTDSELAQQSRALVQIGDIRIREAKLGAAMEAFQSAYRRSAELASRHPRDGRFLFDRAQAEYWIGNTFWQQRNLAAANTWLARYRDSTLALPDLDPRNREWQLETTYGEHNLAVLAMERGDLDAAQRGFDNELATQRRLAAESADDPQLASDVADTISWLGTVAERRGDLAGAQRLFGEQVTVLERVHAQHPRDYRWLAALANAQVLLTGSLGTTGRNREAEQAMTEAESAYRALTDRDPANVEWRTGLASIEAWRANRALDSSDPGRAARLLASVEKRLDTAAASVPGSEGGRGMHRLLGQRWLLRARLALRDGDDRTALESANRALAEVRQNAPAGTAGDDDLADEADALLMIGLAQRAQRPHVPAPAWSDARAGLSGRAAESRYWRILDVWVRLCRMTGNQAEADSALMRLAAIGYVPAQPWPDDDHLSPATTEGDSHVH